MVLRVKKLQPVVTVGNTQRVSFNNQPLRVSTPKGVNTPQQNQAIGIIKDRLRSGQVSREQAGQQIYNLMSSNAVPTMRQLSSPRNTYNQFGGGLIEAQPLRLAGTLQRGVGNAISRAPGLQRVGQNIAEGGRRFENLFNTRGTALGPENSRGTIDEFARAGGAFVADAPLMGAGNFIKPLQAAKGANGLTKAGIAVANYGRGFATSGAGVTGVKYGVNEFQEQYDAARRAGVDPTRATLTGLGSATINALIERAGVEKLGTPLKMLNNTAGRRIASRALSEGTEEGLQTITSNLFSKTYNPETGVFNNVPKSVLFGAALGGLAGGPIELAQNPQQAKAAAKKTVETVDNTIKLADAEKIYTKADQKVKRSEQDVFVSFNKMLLAEQRGDQRSYKSQKAKWKQAQRQLKKAQIARDLADKNRKGGGALSIRDVSLDNTQDLPQGGQQNELSVESASSPQSISDDGQADAMIRQFREQAIPLQSSENLRQQGLRIADPLSVQDAATQNTPATSQDQQPVPLQQNSQLRQDQSQPSNTKESLWLQDPEAVREEMYGKINAVTIKSRGKDSMLLLDGVTDNVAITNAARKAQQDGTEFNFYAEKDSNDRSVAIKPFDPARHAIQAGFVVDANANILGNHVKVDPTGVSVNVGGELINMSQILGDISQWKNTYRMTETMDRNLQRQAPTEEAYFKARRFLIDHKLQKEADFRQELQQQRADLVARKKAVEAVRPDGVSKDEFNSDLFDYIEGNLSQADMMNRYGAGEQIITQYKNDTRALYDQLLDRVNAEFEKYGEATISKRQDYITHINELMGNQSYVGEMFGRLKNSVTGEGEQRTRNDVPGEIAGRTETFEPRKRWNPFFQQRTGGNFAKDPFKAVDAYLEPTLYNIHMTESAVRARAIESAFRTASELQKYETQYMADDFKSTIDSMKNKQGLSKVVTGMQEYANALAGKTQRIDRQIIDAGEQGQNFMKGWQALQRVGGRATIVGNASSVISQTLGLPATIADTGPKAATRGLARYASGDPVIEQSSFVKARTADVSSPFESTFEKALEKGGKPLQYVENQYVKYTWYAQYEAALAKGYKGQEAVMEADRRTERVVAGRGIADRPEAYRSTLINGIAQYTLEVNAQNKLFWQDLDAKQKGMYFVGTFIANSIVGAITGFEPLPDPIEAAIKSVQDFATPDEERDTGDKVVATGQRFLGEFADMNPWVQAAATQLPDDTRKKIFGEDSSIGRFGDQSAPIKVVSDTVSGISNIGKGDYREAVNDFLRIAPAGNQVRKTAGGIELVARGYATDQDGNITYEAPTNPVGKAQAIVFGPSATKNAQQYYNSNFSKLNADQTEQYLSLPQNERSEFMKIKLGAKRGEKVEGGDESIDSFLQSKKDAESLNIADSFEPRLQELAKASMATQQEAFDKGLITQREFDALQAAREAERSIKGENKVDYHENFDALAGQYSAPAKKILDRYETLTKNGESRYGQRTSREAEQLVGIVNQVLPAGMYIPANNETAKEVAEFFLYQADNPDSYDVESKYNSMIRRLAVSGQGQELKSWWGATKKQREAAIAGGRVSNEVIAQAIALDDALYSAGINSYLEFSKSFRRDLGYGTPDGYSSGSGGRRRGSGGRRASGKAAANRALKIASSAMKTDPIKVSKTSAADIKDPGIAKKILARKKRATTPKLKKIRINKNA